MTPLLDTLVPRTSDLTVRIGGDEAEIIELLTARLEAKLGEPVKVSPLGENDFRLILPNANLEDTICVVEAVRQRANPGGPPLWEPPWPGGKR